MEAWAALLLAGGAFVGAFASLIASLHNGSKIENIHLSINSRMDQLLKVSEAAARAAGAKEERDQSRAV
jgi:hypothetical protein